MTIQSHRDSDASPAVMTDDAERLSIRESWNYGSGEIASNLVWNLVTGFLLVYYTDVAMLPVAAMGTLMLTTRALDAVFDIGVGLLVDRTRSRWGKARPYLLFAAIPLGIMTVATFHVPHVSPGMKVVYAYVTFMILGLLYSLLYVPYSALLPMMTRRPDEKVRLGTLRTVGTCTASILIYGLTLPIVHYVGGKDEQAGFSVVSIIAGASAAILFLMVFRNCQERHAVHGVAGSPPALRSVGHLVRNPVWAINTLLVFLIFVRIGVMVSGLPYLAKDALRMPWVISACLSLMSVIILVGGLMAPVLLRTFGRKKTNIGALLLSAVAIALLPLLETSPVAFTALFVASNLVGGILQVTTFVMAADAVEVHEAKFGYRAEGLLTSSVSLAIKLGMAFGVAIVAYTLAWAHYSPLKASPETISAIRLVFYGGQIVAVVLQVICLCFYRTAAEAPGSPARAALRPAS